MKHNIDERNDTSEVCAACACEFDNRSGGTYGQTFSDRDRGLTLCENCIEDVHRYGTVPKSALDSDLLSAEHFDTLKAWAMKTRVLSYCDAEKRLTTPEQVTEFIDALVVFCGGGFHPDNAFADYVDYKGQRTFDDVEAEQLDARMAEAFAVCGRPAMKVDVYELGLQVMQREGWAPASEQLPESVGEDGSIAVANETVSLPVAQADEIKRLTAQRETLLKVAQETVAWFNDESDRLNLAGQIDWLKPLNKLNRVIAQCGKAVQS